MDLPPPSEPVVDHERLSESVPPPVARFLRYVIPDGFPVVQRVVARETGRLRLASDSPWHAFSARHEATAEPPGFTWDARVRMGFLRARVLDRYADGLGETRVRLFSLVPAGRSAGREVGASALVRWLGEAAIIPTALLPGPYLAWEPVDDVSARAVLRVHGHSISAVFTFDEAGQRLRVDSDDRYRDVGGRPVRTPWTGYFHRFTEAGGFRVPTAGVSVWRPAGERAFAVVRLRIESIEYDLSEAE